VFLQRAKVHIIFKKKIFYIKYLNYPTDLTFPQSERTSGGMVDGDLENGRRERADDCNAIL